VEAQLVRRGHSAGNVELALFPITARDGADAIRRETATAGPGAKGAISGTQLLGHQASGEPFAGGGLLLLFKEADQRLEASVDQVEALLNSCGVHEVPGS